MNISSRRIVAWMIFPVVILSFFLIFQTRCRLDPSIKKPVPEIESVSTNESFRFEGDTLMTFPEWSIVWSSQEYANWIGDNRPSRFPYLKATHQFWSGYCAVYGASRQWYPSKTETHVRMVVLGVSYTVENIVKFFYENTFGWLTELTSQYPGTAEDHFISESNVRYGIFILEKPFFEFPYLQELKTFWTQTPAFGPHIIRKWERKMIFTFEYGIKAGYSFLIRKATHTTFGEASMETRTTIDGQEFSFTRYQPFTDSAIGLAAQRKVFTSIEGNDEIGVSILSLPMSQSLDERILFSQDVLTPEKDRQRFFLFLPVKNLTDFLSDAQRKGYLIEHLYDY